MSEIGDVIAVIPQHYVNEADVSFTTESLDVSGVLVDVLEPEENDGRRTLVVDNDGSEYHLAARERMAADGLTEWTPAPVRTSSSVELGELRSIDVDPPDEDEGAAVIDDGEALDSEDLSGEIGEVGGIHRGGKATSSLADRRSARNHRVDNYSGSAPASDVRDELRAGGTAAAVVREFKRLVAEEIRVTDRVGERPDVRNVIRLLAGDDTVFDDLWSRTETNDTGDRVVGIALDMSGSMGNAEYDAKAAVGALALAASAVDDDVVITAFPQGKRKSALVTGPYESWRWQHLDATEPGGGTPMLPALRDVTRLMRPLKGRERVLFAITDGRPSRADRVAELVEDLRTYGTAVVGFGFGRVNESTLEELFGRDGYRHVDVEDLPRALVGAYLDQLELDATLDRQ
ncbi:VWA domain-containing protein [Halogeometricum borinquense]|uniref:VWA domain-containing protein n=1 Tax=Halogeometricum borinquense TaxID=60847 RepID=A0A482TP42_9EURY|nr:vWA domain-containing protein [Halogeometricum borinquense]RYJ15011.1 VWA domain-containing protein [Halogeometricum borinquense]